MRPQVPSIMRLLSVSQLNGYIRQLLDTDEILLDIWVEGEVSNFNRHSSGHCYFTLKEGEAQISAACWRTYAARLPSLPGNGDAVLVHGKVSFYETRGQLQLYVDMIQPAGVGLLQAQFERLRARLEAEGLFEESRKRALPRMPRRIGIATSPTGAALQDILTILRRRYPLAEVIVAGCQVQGAGAADTIVEALYGLYEANVDVIVVARGGGSVEDLWAFNEEVVARAAFASPVPLVSGVGHETDTTIIDFVADVRAPTPSAAAELVTPDRWELLEALGRLRGTLDLAIADLLADHQHRVDHAVARIEAQAPMARIERGRQSVDDLVRRAETRLTHRIALDKAHITGMQAQLAALNPRAILERGYAVVRHTNGVMVARPVDVQSGDELEITVRGGTFTVQVSKQDD
ncbi:MAG TPA: exodeoxyribonuclease VII large subunit [Roseiflexaceae bacterium]|nr:exodeoxyribonuclease VII large subunit [Roseiflexaceae bacterium]